MYNTFLIDTDTIEQVIKLPITNGSRLLLIDILLQAKRRDYFLLYDCCDNLGTSLRVIYTEFINLKPYLKYKRIRRKNKNFYYIEELNI